jgi:hypothetical protein
MDGTPDCGRPEGVFRRSIAIVAHAQEARAAVEDDYHHFRVRLRHDDEVVTDVWSETLRTPWTTCAFAGDDWSKFLGAPLTPRSNAIARYVEMRLYCTHMYELAALAMAAVARGIERRRYDAAVPYGGRWGEPATLARDGEIVLAWRTDGTAILSPGPFEGVALRAGFAAWTEKTLDPEAAEAALILRRAAILAGGRYLNLDAVAASFAGGGCYTTQPDRAATAYRVVGSTLDFEHHAQAVLSADLAWLDREDDG